MLPTAGSVKSVEEESKKLYRELREKVRELYGGVIKNPVVLDAIAWVVARATYVNEPLFPLTVESIGIMGSALWKDDPNDVDVIIEARENSMWSRFREFAESKLGEYARIMLAAASECSGCNAKHVVERVEDELRRAGADDAEILWLRYIPLSSYRSGDILYGLDPFEIVARFIRGGWSRKRIEIHNAKTREHIPRITVWTRNRGLIPVTRSDVEAYIGAAKDAMAREIMKRLSGNRLLTLVGPLDGDDYVTRTLRRVVNEIVEEMRRAAESGDLAEMSRASKMLAAVSFVVGRPTIADVLRSVRNLYRRDTPPQIIEELEERIVSVAKEEVSKRMREVVEEIHRRTDIKAIIISVDYFGGEYDASIYVVGKGSKAEHVVVIAPKNEAEELLLELEKLAIDYCALNNCNVEKVMVQPIEVLLVNEKVLRRSRNTMTESGEVLIK